MSMSFYVPIDHDEYDNPNDISGYFSDDELDGIYSVPLYLVMKKLKRKTIPNYNQNRSQSFDTNSYSRQSPGTFVRFGTLGVNFTGIDDDNGENYDDESTDSEF